MAKPPLMSAPPTILKVVCDWKLTLEPMMLRVAKRQKTPAKKKVEDERGIDFHVSAFSSHLVIVFRACRRRRYLNSRVSSSGIALHWVGGMQGRGDEDALYCAENVVEGIPIKFLISLLTASCLTLAAVGHALAPA